MAERMTLSRAPVLRQKAWSRDEITPMRRDVEEIRSALQDAVEAHGILPVARRLRVTLRAVRRWCRAGEEIPDWICPRILLIDTRLRLTVQLELRLKEREPAEWERPEFVGLAEPEPDASPGTVVWWARLMAKLSHPDMREAGFWQISRWERGEEVPTAESLRKLAAFLGAGHPGYQRLLDLAKTLVAAERLNRRAAGKAAWRRRRTIFGPTGTRLAGLLNSP